MAVLTINREIIEKEGWTLGEFLLMLCAINKIDLQAAKRLLIQKGLMTDHCPPEQYPPLGVAPMEEGVKKFNDLVIKASPLANGSPTTDMELDELAKRLKEIYPKGMKDDKWYWADSVALIKKRLQAFFVKYGRYPAEEIIDATQRYVDAMRDRDDMRLLKYFIFRDKRVDGEVVPSSDLLNWMENKGEEGRSDDWMLHMLTIMSISHKQVIKRGAKVTYKGIEAIVYQVDRPIGFSTKEPVYCLEIQNVKHSELESFLGYGESD